MSLLSQLVAPHGDSVLTIQIPGSGTAEPPTIAMPDAPTSAPEPGRCVDDAKRVTISLLADDHDSAALARLEADLDERVDLWTPALHTASRHELLAALTSIDDAITDVRVTFTEAAHAGSTALLVWMATGRFSRPAFFDDDHLVEPNGAVIRVAGATSVSFTGGHRADRIRCYYDRLSVIQQMLMSCPADERR